MDTNTQNSQDLQNNSNAVNLQTSENPGIRKHRMVFGLDPSVLHNLGHKHPQEHWHIPARKVLQHFDNPVLIAATSASEPFAKFVYETVGTERLYVDSGGYFLYRKQLKLGADNPKFHKLCEKIKRSFIRVLKVTKPKEVFELDNDYFKVSDDLLSEDNFLRKEIKELTGFWPTPVFKMHQGFEYWKALCDCDKYPRLSVGGLAQTNSWKKYGPELKVMVDYAHSKGKKVHFLGGRNIKTFKTAQPDTIDYNIFFLQICYDKLRKEHPDLLAKGFKYHKTHLVLWAFALAIRDKYMYDTDILV